MTIELKNIGMIKEAIVKIDGLTVIAGENDTGKSTVGKALFFIKEFHNSYNDINFKKYLSNEKILVKNINQITNQMNIFDKEMDKLGDIEDFNQMSKVLSDISNFTKKAEILQKQIDIIEKLKKLSPQKLEELEAKEKYNKISKEFENLFHFSMEDNSKINLKSKKYSINFENKKFLKKGSIDTYPSIFIETPIITNLFSFLSQLDIVQNDIKYNITNYPYIFRSLYKQLKLELKEEAQLDKIEIMNSLKDIINGEIKVDSNGRLIFQRDNKSPFNIQSIATGIKSFGILQLLIKNNHLTNGSILIFDEPEVHLHPKWQLEMAKIIIELVKN